jgi:putative peptidoglycan lipid II flippase
MSSRRRPSLAATTVVVGTAMAASRVLGFLRNSVLAALFGQNNVTDAYNTAYLVPDTLYLILIGGAVSSAFIPVLSRYLAEGQEDEAWRVTSIAFNLVSVGVAAIVLLGIWAAPAYVHVIAPWFPPAKARLTVALTRITLIAIFFHSLNGVLVGSEYAHNAFYATSLGPLLYNAAIIGIGVALAPFLGIFGFAWATVLGAFLNFLVQLWGVLRLRPRYFLSFDVRHPGLRRVGELMLPVAVGLSIAQLNLLVNQSFLASSLPPGTINALVLSSRIMLVPVLVATSIGITLLPNLTRHAALGDEAAFRRSFSASMRAVVATSLPASALLMMLALPVVRVLFQHGAFTPSDTLVTASSLVFYAVGIAAYGLYEILSRAFYAIEDTRTPLVTGVVTVVAGFALNLVLVRLLGYRGLALAYSLTGILNAYLLLRLLRRRLGRLDLPRVARSTVKTLLATAVMAGALALLQRALPVDPLTASFAAVVGVLLLELFVAALAFLAGARLFRLHEVNLLVGALRRRLPA